MSVKAIIQEAINRSPLSLKETLEEELRNRIALALEAKMNDGDDEDDEDDDGDDEDDEDDDKCESANQIDEISSGKLGRYIKKASTDIANKEIQRSKLRDQGSKHTFHDQDAENALGDDDEARMALRKARWAAADAMYDKERKLGDKQYKRETGVYTAIKKLSKRD